MVTKNSAPLILEKSINLAIKKLDIVDHLHKELLSSLSKSDYEKQRVLSKLDKTLSRIFSTKFKFYLDNRDFKNTAGTIPELKEGKDLEPILQEGKIQLINVATMHIIYGTEFVKLLTPTELTAVLLHEIGHVCYDLKGIWKFLNNISSNIAPIFLIIPFYFIIHSLVSLAYTFTSYQKEYLADSFAVDYGYGDELISALYKFNKNIKSPPVTKPVPFITRFKNFLTWFFNFGQKQHPETRDRICNMIKQMEEKYNDDYNIKSILRKYKC